MPEAARGPKAVLAWAAAAVFLRSSRRLRCGRRGTRPYDGSTSGLVPGDFVFLEFGPANEEHVNVSSLDTVNQTFTAIVTKNHPAGSSIRP